MTKYQILYSRKCTKCSFHDNSKRIITVFTIDVCDVEKIMSHVDRGDKCPRCKKILSLTFNQAIKRELTLWDFIIEYVRQREMVRLDKLDEYLLQNGIDTKKKYYTIYGYVSMLQRCGYLDRMESRVYTVSGNIPMGLRESECIKRGYVRGERVEHKEESHFRCSIRESTGLHALNFTH